MTAARERLVMAVAALSALAYIGLHASLLFWLARQWLRHPLLMAPSYARVAALDNGFPDMALSGVCLLLFAALGSWRVFRAVAEDGTGLRAVAAALTFCGALIYPFHAVGYVAFIVPAARLDGIALPLASFLILACILVLTRGTRGGAKPEVGAAERVRLPIVCCFVIALTALAVLAVNAWWVGPRYFDGLWYQLPTIVGWYQTGFPAPPSWWSTTDFTSEMLTSWYPGNGSCVGFVLLSLPWGARLVTFLQAPFMLLAVVSLYGCARLMGRSRHDALLAPLTLLLLPIAVDQAMQPLMDMAVAGLTVAALYGILRMLLVDETPTAGLLIAAAASGLALGTKSTSVPLVAILGVTAAWLQLVKHRQRLPSLLPAVALLAAGSAFWPIRNRILLGVFDPFTVAFLRVEEAGRRFDTLASIVPRLWDERVWDAWFGVGMVFLLLVPAALVGALRRGRAHAAVYLVTAALLISLIPWWFNTWRSLHYVVYALTAFCMVTPFALDGLRRPLRIVLDGLLLFACCASVLLNVDYNLRIKNDIADDAWFAPSRALEAALDVLPPGRIMTFSSPRLSRQDESLIDGNAFFTAGSRFQHALMRENVSQSARLEAALQRRDDAALAETLDRMGVRYVCVRTSSAQDAARFTENRRLATRYAEPGAHFTQWVFEVLPREGTR